MVGLVRQAVRKSLIDKRRMLTDPQIARYSKKICRKVIKLEAYRNAKHIALYHAAKGEVLLDDVWRSAPLHGRYCYFPICVDGALKFVPATPADKFIKNQFGILEPDVSLDLAISPYELDLILMPLVAFDPFGVRIGMGKGYYDKTLAGLSLQKKCPIVLGIAYQFQYQPFLTKQPWDVLLHGTVTDSETYWTNLIR